MGCVWTQLQVVVDNGSLAKEHYFAPWLRGVVVAKREKQPLWARDNMDDGTELQAIILSRKENQEDDQALLEDEDEVGGGQKRSVDLLHEEVGVKAR